MFANISKLFNRIISAGVRHPEDYAEIRKVKFLNFTCLLSSIANVAGFFMALSVSNFHMAYINGGWALALIYIIYIGSKKGVNTSRLIFFILWLFYAVYGIHSLQNYQFAEYYVIISMLMSFILFDSFFFQIVLFVSLNLILIPEDISSNEFLNMAVRFTALFIVVVFFKTLVLEVEEKIRLKHQQIIDAERKRAEEREQNTMLEMAHKNRELTNLAVHITQKNEFIESLAGQVESKKSESEKLNEVREILKANKLITQDREEFENYVQQLCEGFYTRLEQLYPGLSQNDKKLAALIRLDLSSKQISSVLNISSKSVDMSRYRLRQKMSLDGKVILKDKLQSI